MPRIDPASRLGIGFVALAAVLSCYPFIAPGHPATVDVWPHLARQSIVYQAVKEGFSPFYTFMFYCGFPVLRFYSPLFYMLGGPLTLLTSGNLLLALRILLVLLHLASALAMYRFLCSRGNRARSEDAPPTLGPALGTIVYMVVPWRTLYLSGCANYPQALVYLLLPLAFLALERILEERKEDAESDTRQALLLGLWVGLLFLSHLVYAIYTLVFLALWALAKGPARAVARWRPLGTAMLAAIGVSAFFLVPFAAEQASHRFPIAHLNLSVPDLVVLLGLRPRTGGYGGGYLGLSVVVMLLVSLGAILLRRPERFQLPDLVGLAASVFLTFAPALLRDKQHLITTGLPPERFLLFVIFFVALLIPSAHRLVRDAVARKRGWPGMVFAVIAGIVMFDCLRFVLRVYFRPPSEFRDVREELYPMVASEPHARLLDVNIPTARVDDPRRVVRMPTVGVVYGGLPSPLGLPYHQYAPRSMLHAYAWVDFVAEDLGARESPLISANAHKALALMGISHLITLPSLLNVTDTGPTLLLLKNEMDWDDRFMRAGREPPLALGRTNQNLLLAASRTAPMAPDTLGRKLSFIVARNWRRLLDTLQLDAATRSLNFIPVPAGSGPESLPGKPVLVIDRTRIRHPDVAAGFWAKSDCFLRIAVSYYPELEVRLDGKPVQFFETADHFTYIRCPAGPHVLSVTARLGRLRSATRLLSLISLPVVVVLILRRKRAQPTDPRQAET